MQNDTSLLNLETKIQHEFSNKQLLINALTHASTGASTNYERLEFLGDRVLGLVVSELLYDRYSEEKEGDLAKRLASLVEGTMLAKISLKISLGEYIYLSEAEKEAGGDKNENILADVFEALIGAMYLDAGLEPCKRLITELWQDVLHTMVKPPLHPKTALQEWAQSQNLPLPSYSVEKQEGPDHAPEFFISLQVKGYDSVIGKGKSRQDAEKEAASLFLEKIQSVSK